MFKDKFPISIKREMEEGEEENPRITLSRLREQLIGIEERFIADKPTADDEVEMELIRRRIAKLEEIVNYKKAA